ncbi:MAG TPA: PAS domain-containing protein [Blastocatellia bacterium]|nr:PAS domain-containing protein [Blastocatellia bacterium]
MKFEIGETVKTQMTRDGDPPPPENLLAGLMAAEDLLTHLAGIFYPAETEARMRVWDPAGESGTGVTAPGTAPGLIADEDAPNIAAHYRILVEQIPAVVFMAFLDKRIGEAYVSPQIENVLGFTQEEWLSDPVRWYQQVHPDDKARWSSEAAQIFLTGAPLRSVYRVIARDGRVIWFRCEVQMVRRADGRPWFIHGVGFDISDLKQAEESLKRREEELLALTDSLLSVQDEERRRIARELHDGTAQNLAGLAMNISLLLNSSGVTKGSRLHSILSDSLDLTEQCSREVRNLSYLLHPPLLDALGLAAALKSFAGGFMQRTGIRVDLELPPEFGRLGPEIETALFRIVQEGLTNVHRHSGSQRASISLSVTETWVRLELRDTGSGKSPGLGGDQLDGEWRLGVGIPGMRERARQLGGEMEIQHGSGGTIITVTMPLRSQP